MTNLREYAQEVANRINENYDDLRADVSEVTKANGVVFTGVTIKEVNSDVGANVYLEKPFEDGVSVNEAASQAVEVFYANKPTFDVSFMFDYENVKDKLRAVLLNESNAAQYPVHKSAKRYGFNDLIITAKISIVIGENNFGSVQVTPQLLEKWGVTKEEVLKRAIENSKKDVVVKTMSEVIAEMMGAGPEELGLPKDDGMLVISNVDRTYGAFAVIAAAKELKKRFPEGYAVLPSSIHEVIVVGGANDEETLTGMVGEVNEQEVAAEEVLGHHAYVFKGEGVA